MTYLNIDKLYLARNIATAILNISQSFQHKVGLNFNFIIHNNNGEITIKQDQFSDFSIIISKSDFEKSLEDRNFMNYTDDSFTSFIGHKNIQHMNSCYKFNITLQHILLSIPDPHLASLLINKFNQ